jgi:hypothetical protein
MVVILIRGGGASFSSVNTGKCVCGGGGGTHPIDRNELREERLPEVVLIALVLLHRLGAVPDKAALVAPLSVRVNVSFELRLAQNDRLAVWARELWGAVHVRVGVQVAFVFRDE